MCEVEKLKFVALNGIQSRVGEMFILQGEDWIGTKGCTIEGNRVNNDSKVKIMMNISINS